MGFSQQPWGFGFLAWFSLIPSLYFLNNERFNSVSDKIARLTCAQHEGFGKVGEMSWAAIKSQFKLK